MENDIVRIGKVNAIDKEKRKVRVYFSDEGMLSDWLKVLKHSPFIPETTEAASGGSGDASFASHSHNISTSLWMPDIDETVLCLYIPVFNGDGFVLGAL
jgi:phage baseplate assembly protein gpV